MAGDPVWRMGAMRYALTLAGYWTMHLPVAASLENLDGKRREYAAGQSVSVQEPTIVLGGTIHVIEETVGRRPPLLGRLDQGMLIAPILSRLRDRVVGLEAVSHVAVLVLSNTQLLEAGQGDAPLQRTLTDGLRTAVEAQHWALRLSAKGEPAERLATLLLQIAADRGVTEGAELLLQGAPDAREMGVLAGVSRENVVLNLAWMEKRGLLRREQGRVWVTDVATMRELARMGERDNPDISQ